MVYSVVVIQGNHSSIGSGGILGQQRTAGNGGGSSVTPTGGADWGNSENSIALPASRLREEFKVKQKTNIASKALRFYY